MRRAVIALAALASPLVLAPAPAQAAAGTFTVLTYNVAGLPDIISSAEVDRQAAHTAIGQRLGPFDVVQVQEDFNYHAHLYAADTTHAYRTPTSGGAGIGSGLNTLSKLQ
ncbi:MAG TPA: endonuclease, partial [Actinoplanes sp.]|nr:endonuclease [Actinoplanes sp.]